MITGRQAQPEQVFSKELSQSDLAEIFDRCLDVQNEASFVKLGKAPLKEWGLAFTEKLATLFVERPDMVEHQNAAIKQVLETTIPEMGLDQVTFLNAHKFFEWLKEKQANGQEKETITLFTMAMQLSRLEEISIQNIDSMLLLSISTLAQFLPEEEKIKSTLQQVIAFNILKYEDVVKKNCFVKNENFIVLSSRKRKKCDMEVENSEETLLNKVTHFSHAIDNKDHFQVNKFLKDKRILQVLMAEDQKILKKVTANPDRELLKLFLSHPLPKLPIIRLALPGIIANNNVAFIKAMTETLTLDKATFEMGMGAAIGAALSNFNNEILEILWNSLRRQLSSTEEIKEEHEAIVKGICAVIPPFLKPMVEELMNKLSCTPIQASEAEHSHKYSIDDLVNAFLGMNVEAKEEKAEQGSLNDQELDAVLSASNIFLSNVDRLREELRGELARENEKEKEEMEIESSYSALPGF